MKRYKFTKHTCGFFLLLAIAAVASPAQSFTSLFSFDGPNGLGPYLGPLVQGVDGNFYGTTDNGGANNSCLFGCGTIFKISPSGSLVTLYSFCAQTNCLDGTAPFGGLVLATDGNYYGTAAYGGNPHVVCGAAGCGTVFKITPDGVLTTLHRFDSTDGAHPYASLLQGSDGNFYGTTAHGGASDAGTIFKVTAAGRLITLHDFVGRPTEGYEPIAGLVEATDGNLYGTTQSGGTNNDGTFFKITPGGLLTTLYSFCSLGSCADGSSPAAGLALSTDGNFYGTTTQGGQEDYGTVFKISSAGSLTTLLSFNFADGQYPWGGLVQATDGNFYGTTINGGSGGKCGDACGVVYGITPTGTLTLLHNFDLTDGSESFAPVTQSTNGVLYGTTAAGGASQDGTVFTMSIALLPFVRTLPTSGAAGTPVVILGDNLSSATGVSFNGTAATFTVISATEIATSVPSGATTGKVQITSLIGTLTSNFPFRVKP